MADLSDEQISELLRGAEERLKTWRLERPSTEKNALSLFSQQKSITPATAEFPKPSSYITSAAQGASIDTSLLIKPEERKIANGVRRVEDLVQVKNSSKAKKPDAGLDWYNLPRTVLTPELKRDLQLLRMRDVLDSKRHYKKDNSKAKVPEFSQVGTIIEGPTEYFSSRLSSKDRKRTFVEEVLAGETSTQRFRTKYNEIQAAKTSGKKAHYKKMKELRRGGGSKG